MTSLTILTLFLINFGIADNPLPDKVSSQIIMEKQSISTTDSLVTGWYYIVDNNDGLKRQLESNKEDYFIDPTPIVTVKSFTELAIYESNAGGKKYIGLSIRLDKIGAKNWSLATEKSVGKKLAFILDNKLIYTPHVNAQITGGMAALNGGDLTKEQLEKIKTILEKERQ